MHILLWMFSCLLPADLQSDFFVCLHCFPLIIFILDQYFTSCVQQGDSGMSRWWGSCYQLCRSLRWFVCPDCEGLERVTRRPLGSTEQTGGRWWLQSFLPFFLINIHQKHMENLWHICLVLLILSGIVRQLL